MENVLIRLLRKADSPRTASVSEEHVRLLAESGAALPPITVHRATMRVIDGTHRVHAALLRGDDDIDVRFFDGDPKDAFVFAVRSNTTHGLPLRAAERTSAARRIITTHPHWSDRAIAEAVGLTAKTVAAVRRSSTEEGQQSNGRVGKDGRVRPLDGAAGRLRAHKLLLRDPETPLRRIAQEVGISISTVWDVRARMARGEDPVPPRQRRKMEATAEPQSQRLRTVKAESPGLAAPPGGSDTAGQPSLPSDAALSETLERLRKDPSLRSNVAGREFLRWVGSRAISPQEWRRFIDRIPAHQAHLIVDIARRNAGLWREFAEQVRARQERVDSSAATD